MVVQVGGEIFSSNLNLNLCFRLFRHLIWKHDQIVAHYGLTVSSGSLNQYFFYPCQICTGGQSHVPLSDQQEDGDETDVSLITGALRSKNLLISEPAESLCGSSVVLRNQTMTVANTNSAGM